MSVCHDSQGAGEKEHLSHVSSWLCYGQLLFRFSCSICEPSLAVPHSKGYNTLWPYEDKYCLLVLAIFHFLSFFLSILNFAKKVTATSHSHLDLVFSCQFSSFLARSTLLFVFHVTLAWHTSEKIHFSIRQKDCDCQQSSQQWNKVFPIKSCDRVRHFSAFFIQKKSCSNCVN